MSKFISPFSGSSQRSNILTSFVSMVVFKNRIHQPLMESAKGQGIVSADPSIIVFHAFHILRKYDRDQFIDQIVGIVIEKSNIVTSSRK